MPQIHPEAHAALMTDRPELLAALRARLAQEGKLTEDCSLLLNALQQAIQDAHEARKLGSEAAITLKALTRSLRGATTQAETVHLSLHLSKPQTEIHVEED
jgi:hypothetical protein